MRIIVRTLMLLIVLGTVAGGLLWSFWPQPVLVELTPIGRGPLRVSVDQDGKTRIKDRYVVSSPLAGRLARIELDPGDSVLAGETLLATLEPNEPDLLDPRAVAQAEARVKAAEASLARAETAVERAWIELSFAEGSLGRNRELVRTNAVSVERLEETETLYRARAQDHRSAVFARDVAQFELEMARATLLRFNPHDSASAEPRQLPILSPINGQVLRVLQKSATVVQPGTPLLELGDPRDLEVEVDVLSSDAVRIRPGTKTILERWGGEKPLDAVVRLVEPAAFTKVSALGVEEQRVNVILDLLPTEGDEPPLGDGFRADARIIIWEADDVLQAPTGALFRHGDEWAVFVVSDGVARLRTVQLGQRNSLAAQILGGLQQGEQVILHPSDQVHDGIAVQQRALSGR